jgi:hypothetical protein
MTALLNHAGGEKAVIVMLRTAVILIALHTYLH